MVNILLYMIYTIKKLYKDYYTHNILEELGIHGRRNIIFTQIKTILVKSMFIST